MSEHTYDFEVKMTCGGCSGAVTRVLKKLEGVKEFDVSLETQKVHVVAAPELQYDTVYETIKKTGKEIISGKEVTPEEL